MGISFPVMLILDAPVSADVPGHLLRAMSERIEACDEVTRAFAVLLFSTDGLLAIASDADDGLGERQADCLRLDGDNADFVMGEPPVGFVVYAKKGAVWSSSRA
jgi:hypothetical protein